MIITAAVVAVIGALLTGSGAAWLAFGFSPDNERYKDDGMLYPGPQESQVLPNLLRDQRRATALVAFGGAVQLVATVLALAGAVPNS